MLAKYKILAWFEREILNIASVGIWMFLRGHMRTNKIASHNNTNIVYQVQ